MIVVLLPALLLVASCAHYPVNKRVEHYDTIGYLEPTAEEASDELFMVLAFSGGGTRAAALSYGILEALARVEVPKPGAEGGNSARHNLLNEADVISSVSGGSFTAAYYALYEDQIFPDLKDHFLRRNIRRVVFIIVDAEKQLQTPFGLSSVGPGLFGIIGVTSNIMINSYNYETIELLYKYIDQWSAETAAQEGGHPIEFYAVNIAFAALPDKEERGYLSRIPLLSICRMNTWIG